MRSSQYSNFILVCNMNSGGLESALKVTKTSYRTNYAITLIFAVIRWLKNTVYLLFANMVGSLSCFSCYKGPEFLQSKSDRSQRSRRMVNRETASCSGCDHQVRLFLCKLSRTQSILNTPGLRRETPDVLMRMSSTAHK